MEVTIYEKIISEILRLLDRGKSDKEIATALKVSTERVALLRAQRDAVEIREWLAYGDTPKQIVSAGYKQQQVAAIIGANRRRTGKSPSQAQL